MKFCARCDNCRWVCEAYPDRHGWVLEPATVVARRSMPSVDAARHRLSVLGGHYPHRLDNPDL
jgi:hypothetical protein